MIPRSGRRRIAPEVIQSSSMDCGPAALKCLLNGHGVPVSYGRLREACQTGLDGSSIDALEIVAQQLGLAAEQVLIPLDHLDLPEAQALPAIVVVRHAETARHFVVVWSRFGRWLQIMDPAVGRRWVDAAAFRHEVYPHEMSVPAVDWRGWAASEAFAAPLRARLTAVGVTADAAARLLGRAETDRRWFSLAALDAATRLVAALVSARGVTRGHEAARLLEALFGQTLASPDDIYTSLPAAYWTARPDPANRPGAPQALLVTGAVLLSVKGHTEVKPDAQDLSSELAAAIEEPPHKPLRRAWAMLREDGLLTPAVVGLAAGVAVGALILETLLFRGLFDVAGRLQLPAQRLVGAFALVAFLGILLAAHVPIALEAARLGRRLEMRLRMALLAKLPRLHDRYFHSRAITDMADRGHAIHLIRNAPALGLQLLQASLEMLLTTAALVVLAPAAWPAVALLAAVAAGVPAAIQPLLNERDLRVRSHSAALNGFYLDALLGLAPIRAHRAEANVRRQHESLLVEWARAFGGVLRFGLASQAVQSTACGLAVGALLITHFIAAGQVGGSDLLLIYWALKVPALGGQLNALAQQVPGQRNTLLRLFEPLDAPTEPAASPDPSSAPPTTAMALSISGGRVLSAGHEVLTSLDLDISPGEHVAIVGPSGAGKSSLIGVFLGWNSLAEGELWIDGQPIGAGGFDALRRQTAWVDPAIQIWNQSLAENLAYAQPDDDVTQSLPQILEAARLREVADRLPHGLRTELGEDGGRLSGGEGQRVRFGRGLMTDAARLVLLDEPFRGLDRTQRHAFLGEARAGWRDATLICVTHDIEDTLGFERVLVVEGGRIVEDGPPASLAGRDSRYRALLAAEREVRESLWRNLTWRRLRLEDGTLTAAERAA